MKKPSNRPKRERRARRLHKRASAEKFRAATIRPIRWLRCFHEAGHAGIANAIGAGVCHISVKPTLTAEGHCRVQTLPTDPHEKIMLAVAGHIATEICEPNGMAKLQQATDANGKSAQRRFDKAMSALPKEARFDFAELTTGSDGEKIMETLRQLGGDETDVLPPKFNAALNSAIGLIQNAWPAIEQLATALYFEGEVAGRRAESILNSKPADADAA